MIDKEIDKLQEMQQELYAMKELKADLDIIEKQQRKIKRQEKKIVRLIEENNE